MESKINLILRLNCLIIHIPPGLGYLHRGTLRAEVASPHPNSEKEICDIRKPATRVFQHFSFRRPGHAEPIRRSVGTRPKVKMAKLEKCDSRLFAIIRGGISHSSKEYRTRSQNTLDKKSPHKPAEQKEK